MNQRLDFASARDEHVSLRSLLCVATCVLTGCLDPTVADLGDVPPPAGWQSASSPARHPRTTLRVMTFNIYGAGANEGKPVDETVAVIEAAGADIVGVQETRLESDSCTAQSCPASGPSAAVAIAEALGYHVYDQTQSNDALPLQHEWTNTPSVSPSPPKLHRARHSMGPDPASVARLVGSTVLPVQPNPCDTMRFSEPGDRGLVWGFRLQPLQPCGVELLDADSGEDSHWLHFNLNDARARRWLEQADLPEEARALFLDAEPRARVRLHPGGVSFLASDIENEVQTRAVHDAAHFAPLRVYVDARRIISGRQRPVEAMSEVHHELAAKGEPCAPVDVLARILERIADAFAVRVRKYADALDDAEDDILGGHCSKHGALLSRGRRAMARLRRHLTADVSALSALPAALDSFCDTEARERVGHAIATLASLAQELEYVQERSRLLQDEITSNQNEAMNRNLYLLSIVTTAALPATIMTGLFGMNVGGLPFSQTRWGFGLVLLLTVGLMAGALTWLMRRNR